MKEETKARLTWSIVVGVLLTTGVRLPLWMMVLMVPAVSPFSWQMHAHIHRVRPVTWKQMKEMPRHTQCLTMRNMRGFRSTLSLMKMHTGFSFVTRKKIRSASFDRVILRRHARQVDSARVKRSSCIFPGGINLRVSYVSNERSHAKMSSHRQKGQ